jgi:hypothetical protein
MAAVWLETARLDLDSDVSISTSTLSSLDLSLDLGVFRSFVQAKRMHTKMMKMTQKSGSFSTVLAHVSYMISGHMPLSIIHDLGSIAVRHSFPFVGHPGLNPHHCRSRELEARQLVCRSIRNSSIPSCLLGNFFLLHLPSGTSQIKLISFDLGIKMQVHMLIYFHPLDNQLVCVSRCAFLMLFKCGEYEHFS